MSFWTRIGQWLSEPTVGSWRDTPEINPATGLPMIGGIDSLGNPHGIDLHRPFDDSYGFPTPSPGFEDTLASASEIHAPISSYDPNHGW